MDLSALSDDEIVAEMQRRLDRGTVGFHGLAAPWQLDYRDAWHTLLSVVYDACNRYPAEMSARLVQAEARRLQDEKAPPVGVYRINTTFFGKATAFQDHAPRSAA